MAPGWSDVIVWERNQKTGRRDIKKHEAEYYFFVIDDEGEGDYEDIYGNKLQKLEFSDGKALRDAAERFRQSGTKVYESDISAEYKVLSKHYYGKDIGSLNTTLFDIEVDFDKTKGFAGPENPYAPINAVAFYHQHQDRMAVYAVPPQGQKWTLEDIPQDIRDAVDVTLCVNEKQLLRHFLEEIEDSDIISGWNSEGYDVPYVYERLKRVLGESTANKLSFDQARAPKYKEVEDKYGSIRQRLDIFGRVHVDYLKLFMKFEPGERDSWALESVAEEELQGMDKLTYEGSLADLYRNDFVHFMRYNVRDCEILKGLEDLKGYMRLAVMLSHTDAARIDDVIGTIKLTEASIINYCHYTLNQRVPDTNRDVDMNGKKFTGAFVIPPTMGLHDWVASIDVTSLYPSAMRTVNISPDTVIGQFTGYSDDFNKLKLRLPTEINVQFEDGSIESKEADAWVEWLQEKGYAVSGFGTIFNQEKQGFIPALLTLWFQQRKEFKAKAAVAKKEYQRLKAEGLPYKEAEDQYKYFDKVQTIYKLKLNSTYGACGSKFFKFYDLRLAESTTQTGQQILFHMARTIGKTLDGEYIYPNDSVIYGDTDSCYFKTHAEDVEEALAIAELVAKRINKSFPRFCRESFCATQGFDDLISVAQEIVASKSIFTDAKKSYMMRVLKDEGKDVDKIKVTGLQIKKTTMPKPIRERMTDVFADFLRGKDWEQAGLEILEFKESLLKAPLMKIGLPMRVKNIDSFIERMNANEEKLMVPGHVRAAILWNKCLEEYNDKATMRIVSGMKIQVYYLKKPIGKFKSIALPVDLEAIPDWFTEHWTRQLSRETQIQKLVDSKLKSMLLAINERIPTRKGLLIDELFS